MDEVNFEEFLITKDYTKKSISSRMSRARKSEAILGYNLDEAVSNDKKMKEALNIIREHDNREENYQNATRNYYEFKNKKEFENQ